MHKILGGALNGANLNNSFTSQNCWLDLELTTKGVQTVQSVQDLPNYSTPGRKKITKKSDSKHSLEELGHSGHSGRLEDFSDV